MACGGVRGSRGRGQRPFQRVRLRGRKLAIHTDSAQFSLQTDPLALLGMLARGSRSVSPGPLRVRWLMRRFLRRARLGNGEEMDDGPSISRQSSHAHHKDCRDIMLYCCLHLLLVLSQSSRLLVPRATGCAAKYSVSKQSRAIYSVTRRTIPRISFRAA